MHADVQQRQWAPRLAQVVVVRRGAGGDGDVELRRDGLKGTLGRGHGAAWVWLLACGLHGALRWLWCANAECRSGP